MSIPSNEDYRALCEQIAGLREDLARISVSTSIDHSELAKCLEKVDKIESKLDQMVGAKGVAAIVMGALGALILFLLQCGYEWLRSRG